MTISIQPLFHQKHIHVVIAVTDANIVDYYTIDKMFDKKPLRTPCFNTFVNGWSLKHDIRLHIKSSLISLQPTSFRLIVAELYTQDLNVFDNFSKSILVYFNLNKNNNTDEISDKNK